MKYDPNNDHQIILAKTSAGVYLQKRGLSKNAVVYSPVCGVGDTEEIDDLIEWLFDQAREYEPSHPNHVELGAPWSRMIDDEDGSHWSNLMKLIDEYEDRRHDDDLP